MTFFTSPFVIAISGVSGGGKTTITKALSDRLSNSTNLFFDDYDFEGPVDIIDWVDRGADYNEWNLDPLIHDLKQIISKCYTFILLDYPFADKHVKTSKWINATIFIDTPLDVAMARRLMRDYKNSSNTTILNDLDNYLLRGRRGYIEMRNTIKPNSDIIVDGTLSVSEIVDEICMGLKSMGLK
ncbi:AAA family ATPase [Aquibacillus koreensis]|uniref:AAA family ATPase n=1 Tax=Aquibacillus koreensis TaxID=279446 RepID=A0A9X3WN98_9BACI|nr:AAA family ATPase [Aquibacillus koreensis]MCT2536888.1 AAA family ATPase [Aquibacillus koreensis]MDC3421980.1 AAA family ATPase [Aquibacillus koreensis]